MSYKIRPYVASDYKMVAAWALELTQTAPKDNQLPIESTFIVEDSGGTPITVASVILTNSKAFCMFENLIANPMASKESRRVGVSLLMAYADKLAKENGYCGMLIMSEKPALQKRYQEFGFKPTLSGLMAMYKDLREDV